LTIYDGGSTTSSMMGKYCGNSIPPSHVSSSNEMLIHFEADDHNANNNGFEMEYNLTGKQNTPIQNNTKYHSTNYNMLQPNLFKVYLSKFMYIGSLPYATFGTGKSQKLHYANIWLM
jgi:hypothetical protein